MPSSRIVNPPARMLVPLHRTPPRWARLYVYRYNRKRYLESLVDAPSSSLVTIDDLPTEILVRIFWFVLAANDNQYVVALPRVCSRWTKIMYQHVYVQGFRVKDYDHLLRFQLGLFADALAASQYNVVLPKDVCLSILGRYRLGMHPRVVTYTILRGEEKEGSEHSIYAARATQKFCFNSYGVFFKDLQNESQANLMICIFVLEYSQHLFGNLRNRLQVVLETKFINRLDVRHLVDAERSVLERDTVWHEFAQCVKESLEIVHQPIGERLTCLYSGVELTPNVRRRIIYLLTNISTNNIYVNIHQ